MGLFGGKKELEPEIPPPLDGHGQKQGLTIMGVHAMPDALYPNLVKRYKGEPFLCTLTVRKTGQYKGAVDVYVKQAQLGSLPKEVAADWAAWIDARPRRAHAPTALATATMDLGRPYGIVWIPRQPPTP